MTKKHLSIIATVFLVIGLYVTTPAHAAEPSPSHIKDVTIYSDQALIKREGIVTIGKGTREILFDVDAFRVDNDSVSGKVFGDGELVSVQLRDIPLKDSPQDNVKTLENKIKALRKTIKISNDEKEVLNKKETFLKSVVSFSDAQISKDIKTHFPKTEELDKTLRFLTNNFTAINTQRQALNAKIEDAEKQIKVLEKDLITYRGTKGDSSRKLIQVVFNSAKEQKVKVQMEYLVYNAYWTPLYRVSVPPQLDGIDLTMFSKIRQKTGEDWHRVSLAVSNALPLKGVALPSLSSWNIDVERPRRTGKSDDTVTASKMETAPAPKAEAPKMEENLVEAEPEKKEAAFSTAQREASALSFEYRIQQVMSIDSQDKETILPLYTKKLEGNFFHYAVPRVNPLTFLVCTTKADSELLSGPINVFFGDRFVGKTLLGDKKAGEDVSLNLGADRDVKIGRETVKDKSSEAGFGGSKVVRELSYKITAENTRDKAVKLRILDTIPVAKSDQVEIKDVKISPDPNEKNYQGKEGVLMWESELKPEEKKEISVEFVISYPKDMPVMGL